MGDDLRTIATSVVNKWAGRDIAAVFSDPTFRERAIEVMARAMGETTKDGWHIDRPREAVLAFDALARELAGGEQ